MKMKLKELHGFFLIVALILFYLIEGINKIFIFRYGEYLILAKIIKAVVVTFALVMIFSNTKIKKTNLYLILLLSGLFAVGQLNLAPNFDKIVVTNFLRYIFPIILFVYLNGVEAPKKLSNLLFNIYEKLIFLNSCLIILGAIFGIYYFKTYAGSRFGYNGLLITSATTTYFYILAIFYYIIKYKERTFNSITRGIVIASIFLAGTKSLYLFMVITTLVYIIYFAKKRVKYLLTALTFLLLLPFCYFFIYRKMPGANNFLDSFTSLRTAIVTNETLPFIRENWSLNNYLFGGINAINSRPQMALLDMLYFLGIIGTIIYLRAYISSYFTFSVTKIQLIFFIAIGVTSLISGNFFINTSVVIYLLILRELINQSSNKIEFS